jgi:hypothetical protein
MENIKCKVIDLYELRGLILGLQDSKGKVYYFGFVNEKGLSEGVKRSANRAGRIIDDEIKAIDTQLKAIRGYVEEGKTEEELVLIRVQKEQELLQDEISFDADKIDFNKIKDLALSCNYQFLYDKLFVGA